MHLLTQGRCMFGQILNNSRHLFALQFLLSYLYLLFSRESDVSYIADWWLVTGAAAHTILSTLTRNYSAIHSIYNIYICIYSVSTISTSVSTQHLQYLHLYLLSIYNIYISIYNIYSIYICIYSRPEAVAVELGGGPCGGDGERGAVTTVQRPRVLAPSCNILTFLQ